MLDNIAILQMVQILRDSEEQTWGQLTTVLGNLFPILWIATAIVSTVWMVVRFIQANFQTATGDQGKYQKAKAARKRALFAWLVGCLWPVLFLVAWPIAGVIYNAFTGETLPQLFDFIGTDTPEPEQTNIIIKTITTMKALI